MEMMSLREYIQSIPIEKDKNIKLQRGCSICGKLYHHQNIVYMMAEKKNDKSGSGSYCFCLNCLSNWKKAFKNMYSPDEWLFSTWDYSKTIPHKESDRVNLYLKENEFYLEINYNPSSRRKTVITKDEHR